MIKSLKLIILLLTTLSAIGQINPPIKINNRYCFDSTSVIGLIQIDILKKGCFQELIICDSVSDLKDLSIQQKIEENITLKKLIINDSLARGKLNEIIGLKDLDIQSYKAMIKQDKKDKRRALFKGLFIGGSTGLAIGITLTTVLFIKL